MKSKSEIIFFPNFNYLADSKLSDRNKFMQKIPVLIYSLGMEDEHPFDPMPEYIPKKKGYLCIPEKWKRTELCKHNKYINIPYLGTRV